jgi:cytochrome c biogenesis protein CcmG, thiol:disulfide interchange protein DsbE
LIGTSEPTGPPPDTAGGTDGARGPGPGAPHPPRRLRSLLIGSVIAAVLAVVLFVGLGHRSGSGATGPVAGPGDPAPSFSLPSLTGGSPVVLDALGKDRHRPVVLNFFASWCVPCQEETPLLARTADVERTKGSVIQFVGVDVLDPNRAAAVAFVQKAGLTYPVGADSHGQVSVGLYALDAEPNTFFIDSSGVVIGHKIGALNPSELAGWLHRLGGSSG